MLKNAFPRIYALAVKRSGPVEDFGSWEGRCWVWKVMLRRQVFDWERDQWNAFVCRLDQFKPRILFSDALAWLFSPKGIFSVGSFRKSLEELREGATVADSSLVWQGICPLKVEIFSWQLLRGRIMVSRVMTNFGFCPNSSCGNVMLG